AVGHRVVHGGETFCAPTAINDEVVAAIRENVPLAPLHNPANLLGIEVAQEIFPHAPQVAVFDTAFHQTMPEHAYRYALPKSLYQNSRVRRYGFHGTSHLYVAREAARFMGRAPDEVNLITLHLGNGASVAAIQAGKSIDTSMGLTPLEGLIMGTRCGDLDPAIPFYLATHDKMPIADIDRLLNKSSGLKGICGSNDLRDILARRDDGDGEAELAFKMYAYRIKKYIGAYYAALGRVDALVFTAGVGENSADVRDEACSGLEAMGIVIDGDRNSRTGSGIREVQGEDARVRILVVPTDEEREIAQEALEVLPGRKGA
ncbi:MAG: acetate kinase, partial [Proteobacteria bacterium]|nr:acetate kinase [Pseudomonadota bacterium]